MELTPAPEDWNRALAVVAHPDDMEFGAAGAVARWTAQGKEVVYCMVTSGEAGIDAMAPGPARDVREAEQVDSADIVGVTRVEFLRHPDGVLEYGLPLRQVIAEVIRRHRPEVVLTNNFRETFAGGGVNQADHVATGRATLDAIRDAGNRWVFTHQLTGGLEPWDGVRQLWANGSPEGRHAVDITDTFEAGVASLEAHRAYLDGLGWDLDAREFLAGVCRQAGAGLGVEYATGFEVLDLGFG